MRRTRCVVVALVLASVTAACSNGAELAASAPAASTKVPPIQLPSRLLGLRVVPEDVSAQLEQIGASYLDSVSLFGFREQRGKNKVLRGALQVGHFNSLARPEERAFRERIASNMGSSVPQNLRIGETHVYMSSGQMQYTFLWFSGDWMYVLTMRRDYPFARTILRRLVQESL